MAMFSLPRAILPAALALDPPCMNRLFQSTRFPIAPTLEYSLIVQFFLIVVPPIGQWMLNQWLCSHFRFPSKDRAQFRWPWLLWSMSTSRPDIARRHQQRTFEERHGPSLEKPNQKSTQLSLTFSFLKNIAIRWPSSSNITLGLRGGCAQAPRTTTGGRHQFSHFNVPFNRLQPLLPDEPQGQVWRLFA